MVIMAKPGKSGDFEKVKIDEWINGEIVEVQERLGVDRKYKDKDTGETKIRKVDEVRLKLTLEGYEYHHYSRWMTLSTNENSNLYKKYIQSLFGSKFPPDTILDVERLTGLQVKTMWDETLTKQGGMFQFIGKIRLLNPNDAKNIDLLIDEPDTQEKEMQQAMNNIGEEPETPF